MRKIDVENTLKLFEEYRKGNFIVECNCCNKRAKLLRCNNKLIIECPDCGDYLGTICFIEPLEQSNDNR